MNSLTWARLLTGVGLGGALPNLIALVAEGSAENHRNANVALVYSSMPFGGALVSAFGLVSAASQWRWIFILGGVVPLVITPIMARYLKESIAFTHAQATLRSTTTQRSGSFFMVLTEGRALLSILLWMSLFLGLIILYLMLNWLPTLMKDNGRSVTEVAIIQIGFNVGGALAALSIGRLLDGTWRRPSVIVAAIALPLLLAWLAHSPTQVTLAAIIVLLLGCAVLSIQAFLYAVAPACYPTLIRGMGVGMAVAVGRIGSIVGPKWGGVLKDAGYNSSQLLLSLVPIAVLGGICAIVLVWLAPKAATGVNAD